ncbi:MAG TPA: M56 family metallopeptidase [Terriglobales bacterium]
MTAEFFLNHVWQSTVFAAAMAGVAWGLRRQQARVRFGIWLAASMKFLLPFGALVEVGRWGRWERWLPWAHTAGVAPAGTVAALQPVVQTVSNPFGTQTVTLWDASGGAGGHHFPITLLVGVWGAGAALLLARWTWRWWTLARIARQGERRGDLENDLGGLRVAICGDGADRALEPGVFGIWHPVVLLPRGFEEQLSQDELAAVLAHERAHVWRRDNLWAAVHGVVECLFWFHPGVWWLGRKLVEERERACDEAVLEAGGDREAYASGIIRVCRYYVEMPAAFAAGVSGGGLRERVAGILHGHWGARLGTRQKAMLWGLGAAVVAIPLAAGLLFGQNAGPKEFDAASVRIAKVPSEGIPIRFNTDPRRLTVENMSLGEILMRAYGLEPYQIKAQRWMLTNHIDIEAETAAPASSAQMKVLLQPFIAKQFGIKMHWATTTVDIYRLTVVPGGLKIKKSALDAPTNAGVTFGDGAIRLTGSMNMAGLATLLSQQLGRPVVDVTGLGGNYDIDCSFSGGLRPGMLLPPGVGNFMISAAGRRGRGTRGNPKLGLAPAANAPQLSAALPEQLGLKLAAAKGPVKYLVIDSANQTPVGN